VEVGNEFFVMEQGKSVQGYDVKEDVQLPDEKIARLVVVRTDRTTSTALVTESLKAFSAGASVATTPSSSYPTQ
jgi:hypothetical protein